ncbi:MAG TPA: hypothetical protein VGO86_19215 [Candidatus Dormibacteraeota bacterium]
MGELTMTRLFVSLSAVLLATAATVFGATSAAAAPTTQTLWIQTMDSCRHALGGASQTVAGPGVSFVVGPGPGMRPAPVGSSPCPAPTGSCTVTTVGCVSFSLPVPTTGSATYNIGQAAAQAARNSVPCNGGSACRSETAQVVVDATGRVQARTTNTYPDGFTSWYPSATGFFAATQADPILFHDFVLGVGSCDGDNDADDRLTGSPSSHCDSEGDRSGTPKGGPPAPKGKVGTATGGTPPKAGTPHTPGTATGGTPPTVGTSHAPGTATGGTPPTVGTPHTPPNVPHSSHIPHVAIPRVTSTTPPLI